MARILLIDDCPVQQLCTSRILQQLRHDVLCHDNPQTAAHRCGGQDIDLVMIELLMHTTNGFEVGLQMREAGHASVLLLTGVYRETDEIWAQALGIAGVITRPLPPLQLQERIEATLQRNVPPQ